jgi:hypothetical protein
MSFGDKKVEGRGGERKEKERGQEKERRAKKALADFSEEYVEKRVLIDVERLGTLEGRLLKATRYWFKLLTGGGVIYLNKAYVIAITPIEEEGKSANKGHKPCPQLCA